MKKYCAWVRFFGKDVSGKIFAFLWQTLELLGEVFIDTRIACQNALDTQTDDASKIVLPFGLTPYKTARAK